VDQTGPACHTGERTCFSTVLDKTGPGSAGADPGGHLLSRLATTIARRAEQRPEDSYTVKLLARGVAKIAQKVGEEAVETVVAATAEDDDRLAAESADLLYHLLVLLQSRGIPLDRVWGELERRER
jgi:phosphoribosyl-AMP cyclohydrolase / phosphoribosyl-ATP pyrophosphohydrolase